MAIYDKAHLGYRVFIGDLGAGVGKYELEKELDQYGELSNVWVARSPPGFAFAVYKYARDADTAVRDLHSRNLCGRRVRVEHAMPYEQKRRAPPPPPPRYSARYRYSRSRSRSRSRKRSRSRDRHKTTNSNSRRKSQSHSRTGRKSRSRSRGRTSTCSSKCHSKKTTLSNTHSQSKKTRYKSEVEEQEEYMVTDAVDGGDKSPVSDKSPPKENGKSDGGTSRSHSR